MNARARLWSAVPLTLALLTVSNPASSATQVDDGAWSPLAAGGSAPSPRRQFGAVYDVTNHRYLIFAGSWGDLHGGYLLFNEIWTLSLGATPAWTQITVSGPQPGERHSPQWGYDPARNRILVFGGYGRHYPGQPYEYLNDVWELSLNGTPTWTELFPTGTAPAGRLAGTAVYDIYRQRFVGFGGTVGLPVDTWSLDLSGDPTWAEVVTDNTSPPGSYNMTSIFDPVRDRMITFGGSTGSGYYGVHNNVWALELHGVQPAWHQILPQGPLPIARRSGTSIYDPLRDRMVIYGGWDALGETQSSFLGDTWALSLSGSPEWTELAPTGSLPIGRATMSAVYDPIDDRMVVFGGWNGSIMLGDTWSLGWGGTASSASLTTSTEADPGEARVQWDVTNVTSPYAAVYRRQEGTPWSSLATLEADASGVVTFVDGTVTPGERYGYMLVVPSERGGEFGGETWVDIPATAVGVDPPALSFALERVGPNPVVDRFQVSCSLPDAAPTRLDVFDLAGRRIVTRDVGSLGAGRHVVDLGRAGEYRPGVYFMRLSRPDRSLTGRVLIGGA
jgi:galactose oxidase-like protein